MKYLIFALALFVSFFVSFSAWAHCPSREIRGSYILYGNGGFPTCYIRVARNGQIKSGALCSYSDVAVMVTGGKLTLSRSCLVSGHLTIDNKTSFIEATMVLDGNTFHGTATGVSDFIGGFSAVRQH